MIPKALIDACTSDVSVSSELTQYPAQSPGDIRKRLYGDKLDFVSKNKNHDKHPAELKALTAEDLQQARQCGKWNDANPSELFLKMYHDVILSLEDDHTNGMTSPSLMGSSGVVPLSIIGPLLDIVRHMSNLIARAEKEVFLATNFWKHSEATMLITNALKELSRRAGERGRKVVVKIIYDRGSPKQLVDNHLNVPEKSYTTGDVKIPPASELPHIDLEVVNFHRPVFGTFHCKYMVVDRRIAVLNSNNLQDNDNVEMGIHLEGPIVDSLYDVALMSWHNHLNPELECLRDPARNGRVPAWENDSHSKMFEISGGLKDLTLETPPGTGEKSSDGPVNLALHTASDPHYDPDIATETRRMQSVLTPKDDEDAVAPITRHLNAPVHGTTKASAPPAAAKDKMDIFIPLPQHEPAAMAMVCRKPHGAANLHSVYNPQNEAFLSGLRYAQKSVFIQTPNLNAEPLYEAILACVRRKVPVTYYVCLGYNDAGELLPYQNGTNEMFANRLYKALNEEEKQYLHVFNYVAKDQDHPIHNKFKARSCHIKIMIVDSQVGIQGNGNQDTQSWFHSQETNVMIDSADVCKSWEESLRRNQNTSIYGAVDKADGCWKDKDGNQAEGAIGTDPGHFAWAKGMIGAVQRVRGAGGF